VLTTGELHPRQKALLTFLAAGDEPVDPIRIQKGMFIFAMEAPAQWGERYKFIPWHWGPFSVEIYSDLEALERRGLVGSYPVPGCSWRRYSVTTEGSRLADQLARYVPPDALAYLKRVRQFVLELSFRRLLAAVYAKYPAYAVKSVFNY